MQKDKPKPEEVIEVKETSDEIRERITKWFAELDAIGGDPLFPEGRKQNLTPIREYFK